jgi:hypothetical protein
VLCRLVSFQEHVPEDGHNWWPKHVAGYAVFNKINLRICICTCWSISHNEPSVQSHESFKVEY